VSMQARDNGGVRPPDRGKLIRFKPVAREEQPSAQGQAVEKRSFYRRVDVADTYDAQRFGGDSGARVNARELALACDLLPAGGVVADVGCGTGRLTKALRGRGDRVIPCDASLAMLRVAGRGGAGPAVQADAFALPLSDGACDGIATVRFLFHFADPAPLLRELRRVTSAGGTLVCDTYSWSPRSLLAVGRQRWGARVATVGRDEFRSLARAAGWDLRVARPCFLISPYVYRRLPLPVVGVLERLERRVPRFLLCRTFWALEAV